MRHILTFAVAAIASTILPNIAAAQCCVSDGNGKPKSFGLGQSFPDATDLSDDTPWAVYEFERDGIRYMQINDTNGGVRAVVGRIDSTFWVLPSGIDADRVRLPGAALPYGTHTAIYRGNGIELRRYSTVDGDIWAVVPAP